MLSHSLTALNQRQVRTLNAHHNGSLPMQLEVLWSLLLQADPEGPTLISCTVTHTLYKSALMAHCLQLCCEQSYPTKNIKLF